MNVNEESEIMESRSFALKFFDKLKHNYTIDFDDIEKCCNKAISDMQKLEKIEQIVDRVHYNICNNDCSKKFVCMCNCTNCEIKMIGQILKKE